MLLNSNGNLTGKVAFVTGAANGIGRATALAFAREGTNVVVADVSEQGNQETARMIEELGGRAISVRCDVTRTEDVKAALDKTIETFGRLDFAFNNAGVEQKIAATAELDEADWDRGQAVYQVMNVFNPSDNAAIVKLAKETFGGVDVIFLNAGIMPNSPLSALKTDEWNRTVDINIKGVLNGIAAVLPMFISQKSGQAIATSSVAGLKAYPDQDAAEKMTALYQQYGISPDRVANIVAFAIDQPEDTNVSEFTIRLTPQPW